MIKFLSVTLLMLPLAALAQKQDVILHYNETFTGGTPIKWQYNNQFSRPMENSRVAVVRVAGPKDTELEFPFPAFNTANGQLGKDFTVSLRLGSYDPRKETDTALFTGISVQLTGSFQAGLAVNSNNRFQAIGMGKDCEPLFYTGKYQGHRVSGDLATTLISITKKQDSLLFSLHEKIIWRQRIIAIDPAAQTAISSFCYDKAFIYAASTQPGKSIYPRSFVIDDFDLTWLARKGDELLAEKLLQDELLQYAQFSKPYFGKYIFAVDKQGNRCVLNKYGNKVLKLAPEDIQVTSDPGIFIRDEGRNEMYNALGEYVEFSAAKTKSLLASARYPEYLQQQPVLEPLYLVKLKEEYNEMQAERVLPVCRPLGIFSIGSKKGLRSSSGTIYINAGFDEIRLKKTKGDLAQFSASIDEYSFWLKKGNETWLVPFASAQEAQLITNQLDMIYCGKCHGFGTVEGKPRYEPGDYVPAQTERVTESWDYVYTSVYGDKWKKTYTSTSTRTKQEAYYKPGRMIRTSLPCETCKKKGYLKKSQLILFWDAAAKAYQPRWVNG